MMALRKLYEPTGYELIASQKTDIVEFRHTPKGSQWNDIAAVLHDAVHRGPPNSRVDREACHAPPDSDADACGGLRYRPPRGGRVAPRTTASHIGRSQESDPDGPGDSHG